MNWQLILDYLRILIWPLIASGVVIYFRKNIGHLIDRITLIRGPAGTEIRAEDQKKVEEQKEGVEQISDAELKKIIELQPDEVKKEYEEKLEKEKTEKKSKDETISYLLEQLAIKSLQIEFERIYRIIFGSQIDLLRRLKTSHYGESTQNTIFFFVMTQRIFPVLSSWNLTQYLNFLFVSQLIYTDKGYYFITDRGKEFLAYIEFLDYPKKEL